MLMRSCRNKIGNTNRASLFVGMAKGRILLRITRRFSRHSDDGGRRVLEGQSISLMNLALAECVFRQEFPFPSYSECDHDDNNRCNL